MQRGGGGGGTIKKEDESGFSYGVLSFYFG